MNILFTHSFAASAVVAYLKSNAPAGVTDVSSAATDPASTPTQRPSDGKKGFLSLKNILIIVAIGVAVLLVVTVI